MGTQRSTVYSLDAVTATFGGIDLNNGAGKGGFMKITQDEDNWTYTPGIGGEAVFNHKPTKSVTVEVTLLQTSKANALLSAFFIASEAAGGTPAPFFFEDRKGSSKMVATDSVLTKLADENYNEEADDVTWKMILHSPQRFVGQH